MLVKNSAIYVAARVLAGLFSIATTSFLTRSLVPDQYGIYGLAIVIMTIISNIFFLWLGLAFTRFGQIPQDRSKTVSTIVWIFAATVLLTGCAASLVLTTNALSQFIQPILMGTRSCVEFGLVRTGGRVRSHHISSVPLPHHERRACHLGVHFCGGSSLDNSRSYPDCRWDGGRDDRWFSHGAISGPVREMGELRSIFCQQGSALWTAFYYQHEHGQFTSGRSKHHYPNFGLIRSLGTLHCGLFAGDEHAYHYRRGDRVRWLFVSAAGGRKRRHARHAPAAPVKRRVVTRRDGAGGTWLGANREGIGGDVSWTPVWRGRALDALDGCRRVFGSLKRPFSGPRVSVKRQDLHASLGLGRRCSCCRWTEPLSSAPRWRSWRGYGGNCGLRICLFPRPHHRAPGFPFALATRGSASSIRVLSFYDADG